MSPPAPQPPHTHPLLAAGGVLVALAAAGVWGCNRSNPADVKPVAVVVSGDTAGWIVPCGCTANQSGGLPRRGSFVEALRKDAAVILADAGGAPGGTSDYHRVKFEAILRGELAMGLAAHNLGGPEVALGADYLRRVTADLKVPFVSANLRDAAGVPVATPLIVVDQGGRRVALAGVLSRKYAGPGLRVDDPREAVLREAAAMKGRYDSLVVLAYAPVEELEELAAALPEADAVIGGPTGQSLSAKKVGPTLLASATNKGKFLVRLDPDGRGWAGKVVEMDATHPDDPGQRANVKRYLDELAGRDFTADQSGFGPKLPAAPPRDYRIAGTDSCRSCHQADCKGWDASKHAHAWPTLTGKGYHVDPYCQQCHTTGYGLPGGFASASRSEPFRGVGCESCHGPSAGHVRDPKVRTPFAAKDQCATCHDRENSPAFEYAGFWEKIRHGDLKPKGAAP